MELQSVEEYIAQFGKLPGIPSAKEVEKTGISIGEMQAKLLRKIEEMTLYLIEIKKENEKLKEKVRLLEEK